MGLFGIVWVFIELVNNFISLKSTKVEHFLMDFCQIIYKPGSVIEDVIYLGLNSHLSSSG